MDVFAKSLVTKQHDTQIDILWNFIMTAVLKQEQDRKQFWKIYDWLVTAAFVLFLNIETLLFCIDVETVFHAIDNLVSELY